MTALRAGLPPPSSICEMYIDCTACAANPKCGWCAESRTCVEGDEAGPLNSFCSFYDYQICSGAGCIIYDDCQSCLSDSYCGWCHAP